MRIGILHNKPAQEGAPNWESSVDVMVQAVKESLRELGHDPIPLPFVRDPVAFATALQQEAVSCVFNLCESVDDDPHLISHPAAILELLEIPFTGSPSASLSMTTNKMIAKRIMQGAGIKTPSAFLYQDEKNIQSSNLRFPLILKSQFKDAGIGIDQDSVITDPNLLLPALQGLYATHGPILVEEFVSGREFNISLFGYPSPEVMSLTEIDFSSFPDNLCRIVGYKAKRDPESFEYRETRRIFPDSLPWHFASQMASVALECYHLFGLRDYGRIDIRLDSDNIINILEVNANPFLSPDAGFPAAVAGNNISYIQMIDQFVHFLTERNHL